MIVTKMVVVTAMHILDMRNSHGPPSRGEMHSEFDAGDTLIYSFALVVCQHPITKRFLLVQVRSLLDLYSHAPA